MAVEAQVLAPSGLQKVALLLIQIGKGRAARVMSKMDDGEVEVLLAEIMRISNVPREISAEVIDELYENSVVVSSLQLGHSGLGYAQKVLGQTFGREKVEEIMECLMQGIQGQPFDFLKSADPREIVTLVSLEHPQTVVLVLAHLRPDHVAQAMTGLSPKLQGEAALRIAQMERTNPEMVALVAESLQKKAEQVINFEEMQAVGGAKPLVDTINRADPGIGKVILTGLEEYDEELADEVCSRMFVSEDIVMLEDRGIQLVLRQVGEAQLALALKGTNEGLRSCTMKNLSERAWQNVMEEVDMLDAACMSQVQEIHAGIMWLIRKMEESGQIVIRREEEDEYVA